MKETEGLMAQRYVRVVGLLGEAGTGKTSLLSSLYLMAATRQLAASLRFAGSATLPGYEQRLRLLRGWKGDGFPEQIVDHTIATDPRRPAFVHLALADVRAFTAHDFLFSDLPGEWTTDLIVRASAAGRFSFLRRSDSLVLAVTAPSLADRTTRHRQVQNVRILTQRLRETIAVPSGIPLAIAITRCDLTGSNLPSVAYDLAEIARRNGFPNSSVIGVASFSARADVPSGYGIGDLMRTIMADAPIHAPSCPVISNGARMISRYTHTRP